MEYCPYESVTEGELRPSCGCIRDTVTPGTGWLLLFVTVPWIVAWGWAPTLMGIRKQTNKAIGMIKEIAFLVFIGPLQCRIFCQRPMEE